MNFNPKKFIVEENCSIKSALIAIDKNKRGLIFIAKNNGDIVGLLTDGDIRRALLSGYSLDSSVKEISNKDFVFASPLAPREEVLKKLDSHLKCIPIIDNRKLINLVSRDFFPPAVEGNICIRSRAPVRVSFGGGGSDVTHYFENQKGAVLNAAVTLYAHSSLKTRDDLKIIIKSGDLNDVLIANNLDEVLKKKGKFGLFQAILSIIRPTYGFDLEVRSDFGIGSGLGGSASVLVSILGCFNGLRHDQWSRYEIAELAFQAERLFLGIAGGWQDQYAAAFGGINFIEFRAKKNIVTPLAINDEIVDELQERLILCDTGILHKSGAIHEDQKREMIKNDKKELVKQNVQISEDLKEALVAGDLDRIGYLLNLGWQNKRKLSTKISNSIIDKTYDDAMQNGAMGGKLLGAGGGGFFLFYVEASNKLKLISHLKKKNLHIQPFLFDKKGLVTWKVRIK